MSLTDRFKVVNMIIIGSCFAECTLRLLRRKNPRPASPAPAAAGTPGCGYRGAEEAASPAEGVGLYAKVTPVCAALTPCLEPQQQEAIRG